MLFNYQVEYSCINQCIKSGQISCNSKLLVSAGVIVLLLDESCLCVTAAVIVLQLSLVITACWRYSFVLLGLSGG